MRWAAPAIGRWCFLMPSGSQPACGKSSTHSRKPEGSSFAASRPDKRSPAHLTPDVSFRDPAIAAVHRRVGTVDFYFVANTSNLSKLPTAHFSGASAGVEWWDPVSGRRVTLPVSRTSTGTEVSLGLPAYSSGFLCRRRVHHISEEAGHRWQWRRRALSRDAVLAGRRRKGCTQGSAAPLVVGDARGRSPLRYWALRARGCGTGGRPNSGTARFRRQPSDSRDKSRTERHACLARRAGPRRCRRLRQWHQGRRGVVPAL